MGGPNDCARATCGEPRSKKHAPYCGDTCKRISKAVHGGRLPALGSWDWLPRRPREQRVEEEA